MSNSDTTSSSTAPLRGLIMRELLFHGDFLSWSVAVWFILLWSICLFTHHGFVLAFGILYGGIAGMRLGGYEMLEGSAEFSFALPPTRKQRFAVSFLWGLATVGALTSLGLVAVEWSLPTRVWGLIASSGLTEPYAPCQSAILKWYALLLPAAVFCTTYAFAAMARSRVLAAASLLIGIALPGILVMVGHLLASYLWEEQSARIAIPLVVVVCPLTIPLGYVAFLRKDTISSEGARRGPPWWIWLIGVIVLWLLISFVGWGTSRRTADATVMEAIADGRETALSKPQSTDTIQPVKAKKSN